MALDRKVEEESMKKDLSRVMLLSSDRPAVGLFSDLPGDGDTVALSWFGVAGDRLLSRSENQWVWPILPNTEVAKILCEDPREALHFEVWFVGSWQAWPLVETREYLERTFGEDIFIGVKAFGELMPMGLVQVVDNGGFVLPASYVDVPKFVNRVDKAHRARERDERSHIRC